MIDLVLIGLTFACGTAAGFVLARAPRRPAAGTYTVKGVLLPSPKSAQWKKSDFARRTQCSAWEPWTARFCKGTVCYQLATVEVCTTCAFVFANNEEVKRHAAYLKAIRQGQLEIATLKAIEAS